MALQFNGTNIYGITFNGKSLTQVNYNGVPVWYALTNCVITGTARVGSTWTAKTTPSEVQDLCSFQWYRGNSSISGANKSTYVATESDRGYQLKCVATIGSASVTSNTSPTILQDVSSLSLSGVAEEGYTLATSVSPSIATGTYQWYRDNVVISGANKSSYTLTHDDAGKYVKCVFTANGNWAGSVSAQTSVVVIGWYSWKGEASGSWSEYASSPQYATFNVPSNVKITHIVASAGKSYVEGEYGKCYIQAYYDNRWNTLAESDYGFSACGCSWSGEIWPSKVRIEYGFNVCRSGHYEITGTGLERK